MDPLEGPIPTGEDILSPDKLRALASCLRFTGDRLCSRADDLDLLADSLESATPAINAELLQLLQVLQPGLHQIGTEIINTAQLQ